VNGRIEGGKRIGIEVSPIENVAQDCASGGFQAGSAEAGGPRGGGHTACRNAGLMRSGSLQRAITAKRTATIRCSAAATAQAGA
jgi:hypothetical protein